MSQQPEKTQEDSFREARKQIVRSAFLALAALGVIVFACYAWFVSSGTVTGKISSVLLNGSTFELASVGEAGALDRSIRWDDDKRHDPLSWEKNSTTYFTTSYDRNAVLWRLTPDSNLGNTLPTGNSEGMQEVRGIQPGDRGMIQFYVIPKHEGRLSLNFILDLLPLDSEFSQILPQDNSTVNKLIRGHLLFSYRIGDNGSDDVSEGFTLVDYTNPEAPPSFNLVFENPTVDEPILITLRWIWPYLLENILNNQLYIISDSENIVELMGMRPEDFFFGGDYSNKNPETNQREFNEYFNNADQYIGNIVYAVLLRLTAVET